jgi:hypothetical protein
MESPRAEIQKPTVLAKNFTSDGKNLKFTWENPIDPVLKRTATLGLPTFILSYALALYKGGLAYDIAEALSTQPNMQTTIGRAGSSKISTKEATSTLLAALHASHPNRHIRQIIVPGESHTYGDSGARYAQLARLVLRRV